MDREIISRRSLPHSYVPGAAHFVTYRLADTLPASIRQELNHWCEELLNRPLATGLSRVDYRLRVHKQLFARYDEYLDRHHERSWLQDPKVAAIVRSNLYHHDGSKYHLMAYCTMPNHVHILFLPMSDVAQDKQAAHPTDECPNVGERDDKLSPLSKIMHSLKSYTANEANKVLGRTGSFWQRESYDHWVRNDDELERIVNYIGGNPVKAGLKDRPEDWCWSSCHDRFLHDGDTSGWLVGYAASVTDTHAACRA